MIALQKDCRYDSRDLACYYSEKALNEIFTSFLVYKLGAKNVFSGAQLAIMEDGWEKEEIEQVTNISVRDMANGKFHR